MPKMTLSERLKQVDDFALIMKERIIEEEHAGRNEWDTWTIAQLLVRVVECTAEVLSAVSGALPPEDFARSCANLSNYSMICTHLALSRGMEDTRSLQSPTPRRE